MRKHFKHLESILYLSLLFGVLGFVIPATAATTSTNISGAVTQSYNASSSVQTGMIVELMPKDPETVVPLANQDSRSMLGVVIPVNDASIVLTPQSASAQQVLVATSGRYNLLVSDQNGSIKPGDYLAISAVAGIGMKAYSTQSEIIGQAAGSFSGNSNVIGKIQLKGSLGHTTNVTLGRIPVDIHLAPNPLFDNNNSLPGILAKVANGVTNKPVNPARVYLSAIMLLATVIITGSLFYGTVHSGIVSIGRNPLAKKVISRSLLQTIVIGLIIFIAGIFGSYLMLNF